MQWLTLKNGDEIRLGDELRITVDPGREVFQGFLNVIGDGYITLSATGFTPVPDYMGSDLGFPNSSIVKIEKM